MTTELTSGLAGLVLCGGRSTRMGRDKALIQWGGRPLVLHAANLLGSVADPILLAPGHRGRFSSLGLPEVEDAVPDSGPLAGLVAGLAASPQPLVAVVAVDMPFASPPLFALMAERRGDAEAVVPRTKDGPHPLHAIYGTGALPRMRSALDSGVLAVVDVLSTLRVRWMDEDEWRTVEESGRFALNLNAEEDLAKLSGIDG